MNNSGGKLSFHLPSNKLMHPATFPFHFIYSERPKRLKVSLRCKTCSSVFYFVMRSVMSWTEPCKFGHDHASISCRNRLKSGDNPLVLNLPPPTLKRETWHVSSPKETARRVSLSAAFLRWRCRRSRGVVFAQKYGKQRETSRRVFL